MPTTIRENPFTAVFVSLCWVVTVPGLIWPAYRELFSGLEPRAHAWQLVTAVFQHGWPGFPAVIHLGLNTILMLAIGPACERLLGTGRMVALSGGAVVANAGVQLLGEGVNGSSLVIWAWGPPIYYGLRVAGSRGQSTAGYAPSPELMGVLFVMYVVITLIMPAIPYAMGWRGNPLIALILANQYHLAATAVGIAATWLWRRRIRRTVSGAAL